MKRTTTKWALVVSAACLGAASHAQAPAPAEPAAATCEAKQEPGFMVSWAGQSTTKDHSEVRALTKGTHLACFAVSADGSKPACTVSLEYGAHYTLAPMEAIRIPQEDIVTLTCKGKVPTCCKVQMTPDPSPLKKGDTKPQREPQLGIIGKQGERVSRRSGPSS